MKINESVLKVMKFKPELEPDFLPAVLWNREFRKEARKNKSSPLTIALQRLDGTVFLFKTAILPHTEKNKPYNIKYVERLIKFLLWQKGGYKIILDGDREMTREIGEIYSRNGARSFDWDFIGRRIFGKRIEVESLPSEKMPVENSFSTALGRNLEGCRIGFDLGGSDRKCAALIEGEVVFSEEIAWSPYFQKDPQYHIEGINDSLKRAAEHLPRVDAIGGSAAGVYINNEVCVGSLYRGLSEEDFDKHIRRVFFNLRERWDNVPFEVANDGEVAALA
ncbi:MAG: ROK family protein, partial [Candidatus Wallbacteria bacterium]|nr:ROK family protein [Candidatus Wallbacteria bacterium]